GRLFREPLEAQPRPRAAHLAAGRGTHHLGGVRVQVLATIVRQPVVVRAQERAYDRTGGTGVVTERLAREHRGELHHARPLFRPLMAASGESDGLMACGGHGGSFDKRWLQRGTELPSESVAQYASGRAAFGVGRRPGGRRTWRGETRPARRFPPLVVG